MTKGNVCKRKKRLRKQVVTSDDEQGSTKNCSYENIFFEIEMTKDDVNKRKKRSSKQVVLSDDEQGSTKRSKIGPANVESTKAAAWHQIQSVLKELPEENPAETEHTDSNIESEEEPNGFDADNEQIGSTVVPVEVVTNTKSIAIDEAADILFSVKRRLNFGDEHKSSSAASSSCGSRGSLGSSGARESPPESTEELEPSKDKMVLENRQWMYNRNYLGRRGLREEFVIGVDEFVDFAKTHIDFVRSGTIRCPCIKCKCNRLHEPEDVKLHLYQKGFQPNYYVWTVHGENYDASESPESPILSTEGTSDADTLVGSPLPGQEHQRNATYDVGKTDPEGRIIVRPVNKSLTPRAASNVLTKCIQNFYVEFWKTWREFPLLVKNRIFDEFKKKCCWDPQLDREIEEIFAKKAKSRVRDMLYTAYRNVKKPRWMCPKVWQKLLEDRNTEALQKKSEQCKKNRNSEKGGSLHTMCSRGLGIVEMELVTHFKASCDFDYVWRFKLF